jgi:hypothetical protein
MYGIENLDYIVIESIINGSIMLFQALWDSGSLFGIIGFLVVSKAIKSVADWFRELTK